MELALLIGISGALGLVALGIGVIVLGQLPPTLPASQQVQVSTTQRKVNMRQHDRLTHSAK
jgi:hypothetical protein